MDFDDLIKGIVPLFFLVVWALTSLFNREGAAQANRANPRPIGPLRPRPGGPPAGGLTREPTMRWGNPAGSAPRHPEPSAADDDVLIIRPEPSRPGSPIRSGQGSGPGRRSGRSRPGSGRRPDDAPSKKPLTSTPDLSIQTNRPMELTPLTASVSFADPKSAYSGLPPAAPVSLGAAADWTRLLGTDDPIRQAILFSELLQPPLSMRPRRPR